MNTNDNNKPYWWPDMQGFAVVAIVIIAAAALFVRMFHTSNVDDKMLDTMITVLFTTCLVGVYNYLFGSSRGSSSKDDMLNRIAGTATNPPATPPDAPPPKAGDVTGKVVSALLIAFLSLSVLAGAPAMAQTKPPLPAARALNLPIDPLGLNGKSSGLTGAPVTDLQNFFNAQLLPDLQYAQKLATASSNAITADCYQAWIDIINTQQNAVKNADGTDIAMPNPHVVTEFEKLVELRNALQPESKFMVKCSPVASMVKKDIAGFIGIVISGGAGLATLVPGL